MHRLGLRRRAAQLPRFEDWEDGDDELPRRRRPGQRDRGCTASRRPPRASSTRSRRLTGTKRLDDYNGAEQEGIGVLQQSAHGGLRYSASRRLPGRREPAQPRGRHRRGRLARRRRERPRHRRRDPHRRRPRGRARRAGGHAQRRRLRIGADPHALRHRAGRAPARARRRRRRGPAGGRQPPRPPVRAADVHHEGRPQPGHRAVLRQRPDPGAAARRHLGRPHRCSTPCGFVRSSIATNVPDLQVHVLPWSYPSPNQDDGRCGTTSTSARRSRCCPTLIYPSSRGTMRLASARPDGRAAHRPGLPAGPGRHRGPARRHGADPRGDGHRSRWRRTPSSCTPARSFTDRAALAKEVPNRATTVYHPVGTCRMGDDERAVVDPRAAGARHRRACGSPTPRSCRASPAATRTHRP